MLRGLDEYPLVGVTLKWLDEKANLDAMLDKGEIDAATGFMPRGAGEVRMSSTLTPRPARVAGNPRYESWFPTVVGS